MLKTSLIFTACLAKLSLSQEYYDYVSECPEENGFFADAIQCDRYYECQLGEVSEKLCPDGLVYDESSTAFAKCSFTFSVDCTGRNELQPPQSDTPFCPRKNGYYADPDPEVCDVFYFCVDGVPNKITCPSGLIFDPNRGQCGWSDQTDRKGCRSKDLFEFQCPDQDLNRVDHSRHVDPESCTEFFLCISGRPRKSGCSPGLVYSENTTACERQDTLEDFHPCRNHFNQTYLDEVLPKPVKRLPSREGFNQERRNRPRTEIRRPTQAPVINSRQPPQPVVSREPDFSNLPPQLQDLATNSDLGFVDNERDTFLGSLRGRIKDKPIVTTTTTSAPRRRPVGASGRRPPSATSGSRFAGAGSGSRFQTNGGSRSGSSSIGSRLNTLRDEQQSNEDRFTTDFGNRRVPQSRAPPRVTAQREQSAEAFSSEQDTRLDIQNLDSFGPSEFDSFLTKSSSAEQNELPVDPFPVREPATTESTEFGARRRVPLTRTRTARPRPAASQQQEQSSAEQTNQRFNSFRRSQIRGSQSPSDSESSGSVADFSSQRGPVARRPAAIAAETQDNNSGGRLEVSRPALPPLQRETRNLSLKQ